jgi:hypothetical protein
MNLPAPAGLLDCAQGFVEVWTRQQIEALLAPDVAERRRLLDDLIAIHNNPRFRLGWLEQSTIQEACEALSLALHAKQEGQPAPDGAEATRPDDEEKRVTPGDEKGAEPADRDRADFLAGIKPFRVLEYLKTDEELREFVLEMIRLDREDRAPPRGPDSAREALEQARSYIVGQPDAYDPDSGPYEVIRLIDAALTGGKP